VPQQPLIEPPGRLARAVAWTRATVVSTIGLAALLVINAAQTASLAMLPISRRAFRRFNRRCASTWWGACVVFAERLNRTRLIITGTDVPSDENAIVIVNHQQMPDITTLMALARSKRRLGDLKFFVKKALQWVPGIGWGMQFLSCPFVARDWTADRDRIARTFRTLTREHTPIWLVSFVEGTRVTPEKIVQSQAFARERGLAVFEHVLVPRTKGFIASVQGLGRHVGAVYDVTIGYAEGVPTLWQFIKGRVHDIHVHVRRFPVEDLPRLEAELAEWLHARFAEKDLLLAYFYANGRFPDEAAPVEVGSPA